MTRLMYDGINTDTAAIPTSAQLVAGYIDGLYAWSAADWARFPTSVHVRIAVFAATDDGHVLDCEPGNCAPAQAVDWVLMRRRAGADPTVYCGRNTWWSQIRAAFQARGVPEPHYWVADYSVDQTNPQIPAGAVALQYRDAGAYDLSAVADYWPGVDPPPEGVPQMEQTDTVVGSMSRGNKVGDVLADISNWRDQWYLPPGKNSNNPPPAGSRLDLLFGQIADIQSKIGALTAGLDPKALAAGLAAAIQPAITQAIEAGIAPEADQLAAVFEQHLAATLAAAK